MEYSKVKEKCFNLSFFHFSYKISIEEKKEEGEITRGFFCRSYVTLENQEIPLGIFLIAHDCDDVNQSLELQTGNSLVKMD